MSSVISTILTIYNHIDEALHKLKPDNENDAEQAKEKNGIRPETTNGQVPERQSWRDDDSCTVGAINNDRNEMVDNTESVRL